MELSTTELHEPDETVECWEREGEDDCTDALSLPLSVALDVEGVEERLGGLALTGIVLVAVGFDMEGGFAAVLVGFGGERIGPFGVSGTDPVDCWP